MTKTSALQVYAVETDCGNCPDRIRMYPPDVGFERPSVWLHQGTNKEECEDD